MSGLIPQDFIIELLSRVDIADVIQLRIPLKKKGSEYAACCPFHGEKTPSFYVTPAKQFYHCFGCGAHGTAISFLMEYENLSFPEAIELLAQTVGMEVPRSASAPRKIYDHSGISLLTEAANIYYRSLQQLPADHDIKQYIQNRGLNPEIIETYQIGYAGNSIADIKTPLSCDDAALVKSGLLSEGDNGLYARFRDRIMFPIRNRKGEVIGFGGRALGDAKPKYLNSAETDFFHKGEELYGLYEARKSTPRLEQLIVVEGYMDVVALAQYGITNAVATLGTATTTDHAQLLARIVRNICFCFDGDEAGRKAAWKAADNMLPALRDGLMVSFLFLPDGEDPDSMVRKEGKEAFQKRITDSLGIPDFIIQHLSEQHNINNIGGRANFLSDIIPLFVKIPSGTHSATLLPEIATITRQHESKIIEASRNFLREHPNHFSNSDTPRTTRAPNGGISAPDVAKTPLRRAIALLLCAPQLHQNERVQRARAKLPRPSNNTHFELLHHLLEILDNNPTSNTAMIIAQVENPRMQQALGKLATWRPIIDDELLADDLIDALTTLSRTYNPQKAIFEKLQSGELLTEEEQRLLQKSPKPAS
jgi:DNA primase